MRRRPVDDLVPNWIDGELRNWSRWCWSGEWPHPLPIGRAASIEGHYLPESDLGADVEHDEIARRVPVIADRAERVHAVYRSVDRRAQRAMKLRYIDGWPAHRVPMLMHVSVPMYEAAMLSVVRCVSAAFEGR